MTAIMVKRLQLLLLLVVGMVQVPMLEGCRVVSISNNHPPSHASLMTTYTRTNMTSSGRPVYKSDTSDSYLYHIPARNGHSARWVVGKTVGATDGYTMFVKSDHSNADEITGQFFTLVHGVWKESANVNASCAVENVALGKPASQSSTATDGSNTAGLAVDGEKGTSVPDNQCTLTNPEISPWWEVDLGGDWPIETVRVLNRGDCCGRLLENFEVRIKGREWQSWGSSEMCGVPNHGTLANGQSITVDCGPPIVGRYVRIQLPERSDTDVLSVCEVEVFPGLGCPAGSIVHGGICYMPVNTPMNYGNARATCQHRGGTLSMPRHRHINAFLTDTAIREDMYSHYWIGLFKENGDWTWEDGNRLSGFRGWGTEQQITIGNCTVLRPDGTWQVESCETTAKFFCQVQAPVDLATVGYQKHGGAYLRAFSVKKTLDEAKVACDQFGGGRLAQPTTREFNDILTGIVGEASADEKFWIGLKMFEDFWSWSDGTPSEMSYSSWASGQPSGQGCVTTTSTGEWSVKNCDEEAFYVCQIGDESLYEMDPYSKVRCGGTIDGSFGQIVSPGYGQSLNNPEELDCEWKITVPDGKVVQFTFGDFQLEENGNLEIFDFCPYGNRVESLSGTAESNLTITTTANEAFLKFSSSGLQPTHRFNISFQAISPPHRIYGLQNSQHTARNKRAAKAGGIKAGLKEVASFVSDLLFSLAGVVFNILNSLDTAHEEVLEKLNVLERKVDDIYEAIRNLGIMTRWQHEMVRAVQLYAESETRIKDMLDTLRTRFRITRNGTLEPILANEDLVQEWVDNVLTQGGGGMNSALNNMHRMVMGTESLFHGKSYIKIMDDLLKSQNHPTAIEQLRIIAEYIIDLQLSAYVAWILALRHNGDMGGVEEIMKRGHNKLSQQNCFMARYFYDWPAGTYGFPMATGGCPNGSSVTFEEGQYGMNGVNGFQWSQDDQLHLSGGVSRNTVKQRVCMKTTYSDSEDNVDWPKGSYCLFKYRSCPEGFSWGRLGFPGGTKTGVIPDGDVASDSTEMEYCCRNDGVASLAIRLPSRSPFYLLRHGGECQQVDGATVREEWIEYTGNGHRAGMTPDDDGDDNSHKIYYCFYSASGSSPNIPATPIISAAVPAHTANVISYVTCVIISLVTGLWALI
ncbi:PREDICTED: uncharacterized protein LOC109468288 isoform X2 [Branchiostoma belcheri]|uniref:Uncharacterized protein LOC109468288 isoform X2 n=1 Tax=Branchiostoma belcheri TaxID=7741 RepID=A0A6P4YCG6_BRABE|nr:PREDICTED: uncharacterized protein LOC109468288 isoform X2 [Branchiostoma belcheri]